MLFVIVVILLCPLLALALLWTPQKRLGLPLLTISMAASLVFGLYNHFLVRGSDHVSAQPPGPAGTVFVATAYLLFLTEAVGTSLGLYFLAGGRHSGPQGPRVGGTEPPGDGGGGSGGAAFTKFPRP